MDVQVVVNELGKNKISFLDEVESSIKTYLENKSWQECITIVERWSDGSVKNTWKPSELGDGFGKRFYAFLRKKRYDGCELDSGLTDGVVSLVTSKFEKFYSDNSVNLAKPLTQQLIKDRVFVKQLASQIVEVSKGSLPTVIKNKLTAKLIHALEDSMNINFSQIAADQIHNLTAHVIAIAASAPISKTVMVVLMKYMAVFLKGVIAKMLAATAVKTMLMALLKKLLAVKIIAAIGAIVLPFLGGVPVWAIVAPLLAAFLAYEVYSLPRKMGEKVSQAVRSELNGEFDKINTNIAENILSGFTKTALNTLISDIAHDVNIKEAMKKDVFS